MYDFFRKKTIEPHELFNAIDTDEDMYLTCDEIKNFTISLATNTDEKSQLVQKELFEKDIRIFIQFMDVDKNGVISKAEFLKQYQKLEQIVDKHYLVYKQIIMNHKS